MVALAPAPNDIDPVCEDDPLPPSLILVPPVALAYGPMATLPIPLASAFVPMAVPPWKVGVSTAVAFSPMAIALPVKAMLSIVAVCVTVILVKVELPPPLDTVAHVKTPAPLVSRTCPDVPSAYGNVYEGKLVEPSSLNVQVLVLLPAA